MAPQLDLDSVIAEETPLPQVVKDIPHGSLFCWDSEHLGYSYWMVFDTYLGHQAHELLPEELDPRTKPPSEIVEKAEYEGIATEDFILDWHSELPTTS